MQSRVMCCPGSRCGVAVSYVRAARAGRWGRLRTVAGLGVWVAGRPQCGPLQHMHSRLDLTRPLSELLTLHAGARGCRCALLVPCRPQCQDDDEGEPLEDVESPRRRPPRLGARRCSGHLVDALCPACQGGGNGQGRAGSEVCIPLSPSAGNLISDLKQFGSPSPGGTERGRRGGGLDGAAGGAGERPARTAVLLRTVAPVCRPDHQHWQPGPTGARLW